MSIRTATIFDAFILFRIAMDSVAPHKDTEFHNGGWEHFLLSISVESTLNRLASNRYRCFCYTQNGEAVGFITIRDLEKIDQLFVSPGTQRKGIARALWEHARRECLALKQPPRFWVRSSRQGVPIYRRFGFVEDGGVKVENGIRYQVMRLDDLSNE